MISEATTASKLPSRSAGRGRRAVLVEQLQKALHPEAGRGHFSPVVVTPRKDAPVVSEVHFRAGFHERRVLSLLAG
jgi:hypothetical protein